MGDREADLQIRFVRMTLKPELGELTLWAIVAEEVNYADDVKEPIEWLLLTTIAVTSIKQAVEKVDWYGGRWGIEVYHRTLKSGCKIEERQLGDADSIEACLAIDMVVASREQKLYVWDFSVWMTSSTNN